MPEKQKKPCPCDSSPCPCGCKYRYYGVCQRTQPCYFCFRDMENNRPKFDVHQSKNKLK
uniref:Uncharacterized protein n=1 Tax=viral metagenome TaxID=1070528 RepID=A0A6C0L3P5_9ZZZZ